MNNVSSVRVNASFAIETARGYINSDAIISQMRGRH
jgi:hypothetical protein